MREILLAFLGGLCPAILFNVEKAKILWVGLGGSLGWAAYTLLMENTGQVILSTFAGAVVVGIFSETMARVLKTPATVFSVSGIFPLVPGIGAYQTIQLMTENNLDQAAGRAVETVASAGAIALGIMLMSATFKVLGRIRAARRTL